MKSLGNDFSVSTSAVWVNVLRMCTHSSRLAGRGDFMIYEYWY